MIANALGGQRLPVYGDGLHVRDWVHVLDLCQAILLVLEKGNDGGFTMSGVGTSSLIFSWCSRYWS
jgi:dTDP-D-glucose 4,6-dehydratase